MVNYCSVAGCTNSSRNSPDISFHFFPKDLALRRKWRKFCRRADKGFEAQENPRICAAHFKISDFKKGTSPSIFKVAECKENNSPRDRRSEKRKRPEHMEDCTYQPLKEARITQLKSAVAAEAVKHDYDYCSHKDFHDKSTQTNFDLPQELQVSQLGSTVGCCGYRCCGIGVRWNLLFLLYWLEIPSYSNEGMMQLSLSFPSAEGLSQMQGTQGADTLSLSASSSVNE
ncbi:hypothetical protein P5673_029315 [Acropora cervicornis]|uniref:THAP-type domain-containing protein n=1 Tax=Acropora cervicornis TaxID=6130 RepID=A0AAD9PW00_ACRCE|nr:hypothetical protein P5673_029315 [Acropora cervicornis]